MRFTATPRRPARPTPSPLMQGLAAITVLAAVAFAASPTLVLKRAGSMDNSLVNGELVSLLRDHVVFVYEDVTVSSESATWWRDQGIVEFTTKVDVARDLQRLTCNRMRFTRGDNMLTARDNVVYADKKEHMVIKGQQCRYNLKTRQCLLDGAPEVVRYDSAAADTMIITGRRMSYDDSLKLVTAADSVVIRKGDLVSRSRFAYYLTKKDIARLRQSPRIAYDRHRLAGDSVDLYFHNDTLRGVAVGGHSTGLYVEEGKVDTSVTKLWGDSIYMVLTDTGYPESVWIHGNVLSRYFLTKDTESVNEVSGKTMILAFAGKNDLRNAKLWGNARSTYYIEGEGGSGRNEASGDTLSVWFENGKAVRLRSVGGVRGTYYPKK